MDSPVIKQRRTRPDRPFGRSDFHAFDLSSSPLSLGHHSIGKVIVDCKFLFTKSRWGTIGPNCSPAAILYIDLSFQQPKGYELDSAEVRILLDDEDIELFELHNKSKTSDSKHFAHITDWYGPKSFAGSEVSNERKRSKNIMPEVGAGGVHVGGVGLSSEYTATERSRWRFTGQLLPGSTGPYKILKWELSENDFEAQPNHHQDIHTAFAFGHNGEPLYLRVEIKGKLKSMWQHLTKRLRNAKFPSASTRRKASTVTLVDFGGTANYRTPLDMFAHALPREMYMENCKSAPGLIPDSAPDVFEDLQLPSKSPVGPDGHRIGIPQLSTATEEHNDPAARSIDGLLSSEKSGTHLAYPSLADLAQGYALLTASEIAPSVEPTSQYSSFNVVQGSTCTPCVAQDVGSEEKTVETTEGKHHTEALHDKGNAGRTTATAQLLQVYHFCMLNLTLLIALVSKMRSVSIPFSMLPAGNVAARPRVVLQEGGLKSGLRRSATT